MPLHNLKDSGENILNILVAKDDMEEFLLYLNGFSASW